jgi:hypothetical protein
MSTGKFNGEVQATSINYTNFCPGSESPQTSSAMDSAESTTSHGGTSLLDNEIVFFTIIGSSGGIGLLVCLITIVCCGVCCLMAKRRKMRSGKFNLRGIGLHSLEEGTHAGCIIIISV